MEDAKAEEAVANGSSISNQGNENMGEDENVVGMSEAAQDGDKPEEKGDQAPVVLGAVHKRKRLVEDRVGLLEDKISKDEYDINAWQLLIAEHTNKGRIDECRATYERYVKVFPTAAKIWIAYADMELSNNDFEAVGKIFGRCLLRVLNVDLWRFYLSFIRRVHNTATSSNARQVITQAFEFVIQNVGIDPDSTPIWRDYIEFLEQGDASSEWERGQKRDHIRKIYQKAVTIPLRDIESLWRDYDQFENGIDKTAARRFLAEKSPAYMTARTTITEISRFLDGLDRMSIPQPLNNTTLLESNDIDPEIQNLQNVQSELWHRWVMFEMQDPLVLEDKNAVSVRVIYAYRQALMPLRFQDEVWFDAATYCFDLGKSNDGTEFLRLGLAAIPSSSLLNFYFLEREEIAQRYSEIDSTYRTLIEETEKQIAKIIKEMEELKAAVPTADQLRQSESARKKSTPNESGLRTIEAKKIEQSLKAIDTQGGKIIDTLSKKLTLAWVNYMKAVRRTRGVKAAREIFRDARVSKHICYEIYVASALMEHHCNNETKVANKVFEFGMRTFSENAEYVREYLRFMLSINDAINARALFEKSVGKVQPPESAIIIIELLEQYEAQFGDLSSVLKLRARKIELNPSISMLEAFDLSNGFLSLSPITTGAVIRKPRKIRQKHRRAFSKSSTSSSLPSMDSSDDESSTDSESGRRIEKLRKLVNPPIPWTNATNSALNGTENTPPAIYQLLQQLPPAQFYDGPKFQVDRVIDLVRNVSVPFNNGM